MHCTAAGAADDRVRMADAGEAPGADDALADEALEHRPDMVDKGRVWGHAGGGVGPAGQMRRVGHDVRVQEKHIEPRQAQPLEASLDRAAQYRFDLGRSGVAEVAFAGDPHPRGEAAGKGGADDLLGLAVAVARREIEEGNARLHRGVHGQDAFLEGGFTPHHPEPAAAQGQCRYRRHPAETVLLHRRFLPS
jgi:hypothetical protein